jgi:SRSO17 transposase
VDRRGQNAACACPEELSSLSRNDETQSLLDAFNALWEQAGEGFGRRRSFERAQTLALSSLVAMGRHTVTALLSACGRQFHDWTADYRLFSRGRVDADGLFDVVRRAVLEQGPKNAPLVAALDDSLLRKRGKKTYGVAYRRDPLGPAFHVNFVRGQRFLQISAAMPRGNGASPARMVPIDFRHCPTPLKPRKNSPENVWKDYRQAQKEANISLKAVERLHALRSNLEDDSGDAGRLLVSAVDGRFTNGTVLRNLPENTALIGRIRKDAKLYSSPTSPGRPVRGRRPSYGDRIPTPEEIRRNESIPWQKITVFAAGKKHTFSVKHIAPVRWRTAGPNLDLRLVIIRPLAYRMSRNSRVLYRQPAYLICTDFEMPLERLVQYYIWRWGIEVNFRDEKQLLGIGQAQVRHPDSVEKVPAFITASYAMMLVAARKAFGAGERMPDALPQPKWRCSKKREDTSTQQLINHLRAELWGKGMGLDNFSDFMNRTPCNKKPEKLKPDLASAVLYACN